MGIGKLQYAADGIILIPGQVVSYKGIGVPCTVARVMQGGVEVRADNGETFTVQASELSHCGTLAARKLVVC